MKAMIVSNTPWGYGSPQVGYLRDSFQSTLGISTTIYAPVYSHREIVVDSNVVNIVTEHSIWSPQGLVERLSHHLRNIHLLKPEILVLVNPENLILLKKLKYRPKLIVYYALEEMGTTLISKSILFSRKSSLIDLMISPEVNRAKNDSERLKLKMEKTFIVMNCPPISEINTLSSSTKKFSDFLYTGTLNETSVDLDTLDEVSSIGSTEIYGSEQELRGRQLKGTFMGLRLPAELVEAHHHSNFSLTLWKNIGFNNLYAAPNKIFQSISWATPFVTYPYPQASSIVHKYGCGILAADFTPQSFLDACKKALEIANTEQMSRMRSSCEQAARDQLNWEMQILPVLKCISERLQILV